VGPAAIAGGGVEGCCDGRAPRSRSTTRSFFAAKRVLFSRGLMWLDTLRIVDF
jgi:hypothetical protein